ncbi:transcription repressor OFP7-like [Canna indica]|uniref:Transcription repressor n=1 Tax=Canna indica TaxID=4628 RepID=A0AAQ3JQW5_9LILI|nr:transcription repressor OFP7-like [Canna indica]
MAKDFRLRLWSVFPAFRSCRSKDVNAVAVVSPHRPPRVDSGCFDIELLPLPAASPLSHRKPPLIPSRCCHPRRLRSPLSSAANETPGYLCRREEEWRAVAAGAGRGDLRSSRAGNRRRGDGRHRRRPRRREGVRREWGNSPSADEYNGWFSSQEVNGEQLSEDFDQCYGGGGSEEERETFISSTDVESSENYVWQRRMRTIGHGSGGERMRMWEADEEAAVAVVKQSEDPREDFRRSMVEMVVEKKIFDAVGLEQLLSCFLSLNSRDHHAAIVAAFEDIYLGGAPPGAGLR